MTFLLHEKHEKQTVTRYFRSFMSEEYLIKVPAQLVNIELLCQPKQRLSKDDPKLNTSIPSLVLLWNRCLQIHIAYTFFSGVVDKTNVIILTRFTLPSTSFTFFNTHTPWRKSAFSNVATTLSVFATKAFLGLKSKCCIDDPGLKDAYSLQNWWSHHLHLTKREREKIDDRKKYDIEIEKKIVS